MRTIVLQEELSGEIVPYECRHLSPTKSSGQQEELSLFILQASDNAN
jgi:hypothetical protein